MNVLDGHPCRKSGEKTATDKRAEALDFCRRIRIAENNAKAGTHIATALELDDKEFLTFDTQQSTHAQTVSLEVKPNRRDAEFFYRKEPVAASLRGGLSIFRHEHPTDEGVPNAAIRPCQTSPNAPKLSGKT